MMNQELEIVLYGAAHCGFGWYAAGLGLEGGYALQSGRLLLGEGGQKLAWQSVAAAIAAARTALKAAGAQTGAEVRVLSPKGRRMKSTEVK